MWENKHIPIFDSMNNSTSEITNESKQLSKKDEKQSYPDKSDTISEIEKFYLRTKEDWL